MALKIDKAERDGAWTVTVRGDVDLYTSPELRDALLKLIPKTNTGLAVDLRHVLYMDSSGVATLVEALKMAGRRHTEFVLVSPSDSVMKVLQLARLDTVFDIRESL